MKEIQWRRWQRSIEIDNAAGQMHDSDGPGTLSNEIWYPDELKGSSYCCKMGYPGYIKIVTQSQDAMNQVGAGGGGRRVTDRSI